MSNEDSQEFVSKIQEFVSSLKSQDNCGTRTPIAHFIQCNIAQYARDFDDIKSGNAELVFLNDGAFYTIDKLNDFDDIRQKFAETYSGMGFRDVHHDELISFIKDEFSDFDPMWRWFQYEDYLDCGVFFTREAARQFAETNLHHVGKDYRIYVRHFWRNYEAEMIVLMAEKFLELAELQQKKLGEI